jgi:hypothetical protein
MKPSPSILAILAAALVSLSGIQAQTIFSTDFSNMGDYDDNFVKLPASGTADVLWNASGFLNKTGDGARGIIFDTSATGGSDGSGGSSGSHADNGYGSVTVSSVFRIGTFNTASMGYWAHVNDEYSSGYLGLINFVSSSSLRLRIFDSNANPSGSGVGTLLSDQTISVSLSTGTNYMGVFVVTNDGTDAVNFTLSLYNGDGTVLIASISGTDVTSPVLSGQVGLRFASTPMQVDSFSVVPEPSVASLLAVSLLGLVLKRRLWQN